MSEYFNGEKEYRTCNYSFRNLSIFICELNEEWLLWISYVEDNDYVSVVDTT